MRALLPLTKTFPLRQSAFPRALCVFSGQRSSFLCALLPSTKTFPLRQSIFPRALCAFSSQRSFFLCALRFRGRKLFLCGKAPRLAPSALFLVSATFSCALCFRRQKLSLGFSFAFRSAPVFLPSAFSCAPCASVNENFSSAAKHLPARPLRFFWSARLFLARLVLPSAKTLPLWQRASPRALCVFSGQRDFFLRALRFRQRKLFLCGKTPRLAPSALFLVSAAFSYAPCFHRRKLSLGFSLAFRSVLVFLPSAFSCALCFRRQRLKLGFSVSSL